MKECNYPVKYALLPIKEYRTNKMGKEYQETVCHVVAKAYVVEEYRKYNEDGTVSSTYKICFPHVVLTERVNHFRKTPDSPLARDNEMVTSSLYDTFEEAQAYRDERNLLVDQSILDKYKDVENELTVLTSDLTISSDTKKEDKIKMTI